MFGVDVAFAVAVLGKGLRTVWAGERSGTRVLAQVIAQVATFLEQLVAVVRPTLENNLLFSGEFVAEIDALVPIFWEVRKRLRSKIADASGVREFVGNDAEFVDVDEGTLVSRGLLET